MKIAKEDIIGFITDKGLFCTDCADKIFSPNDWDNLTSDAVITESDRDDSYFLFCDHDNKMI